MIGLARSRNSRSPLLRTLRFFNCLAGARFARVGTNGFAGRFRDAVGYKRLNESPEPVRILILYANPVEASFGAALHGTAIETLRSVGHEIDDCDLYAESFDPILSREERIVYHDTKQNRARVRSYVDRLLAAEGLILIYPVWNEGFPAILKGYIDRVFLPGVSFNESPEGDLSPSLPNLNRIGAICTYGADRWTNFFLGDPPRRIVKRLLRALPIHRVPCDYLAHYDMNHSTSDRRRNFIRKVKRALECW
jgi:NAD(P)H dehydrogenase (quinone)